MTKFRELSIGDQFDWIDPNHPSHNSFYHPCVKTGPRTYKSIKGMQYRVGSINAKVYHVNQFAGPIWQTT
jgi:hypothetical protein